MWRAGLDSTAIVAVVLPSTDASHQRHRQRGADRLGPWGRRESKSTVPCDFCRNFGSEWVVIVALEHSADRLSSDSESLSHLGSRMAEVGDGHCSSDATRARDVVCRSTCALGHD